MAAAGGRLKRMLWFAAFWLAGVLAVTLVGLVIRAVLA
jgi:hypothetical protein